MVPLEHLGRIGSSTIAFTLVAALAGCTSGETFGTRTAAPAPTAALPPPPPSPAPGAPSAPPPTRQPVPREEPDEAFASDDVSTPVELPDRDVTMLDTACSSDLGFEFQLRQHEPAALPLQCVTGEALFGCAAPPAPRAVPSDDEACDLAARDGR